MQKITLFVEGNKFDISVQDDHVAKLKSHIFKDLGEAGNNTLKDLLYAYMKKCYEINVIQLELEGMSKKLDELSKRVE
jgi:hypothetical protein